MNSEEKDFLRTFFQQVVDAPLDPASDRRYVPLYGDGAEAIGEDPVELLARAIEWSPGESVRLLSGFRGTGKSTELRRLRSRLRGAGYHVALIDMRSYVNLSTPVDVSDFLIALAGATGEALADKEILGSNATREGYWTRAVSFITKTKIDFSDVSPGFIKANLKSDPTFLQQLQVRMAGHLGALVAHVRAFFEDCVKDLKKQHGDEAELVLLVDSVDHIRGTLANALDVQASIETLFASHADKLRLPNVHVVYTVPPYLKVRYPKLGTLYGAGAVQIFPAIKIRYEETGGEHDGGIQALRRVVAGRGDVVRLFGEGDLLRRVVLASGGHLRDLLRLVSEVLLRARAVPVDEATVEDAINQIRAEVLPIADDNAAWLARIATTHQASLVDDEHLPDLARFLDTAVVLCYRDGPEWYDVHPLIKEIVIKQARDLEARAAASIVAKQS